MTKNLKFLLLLQLIVLFGFYGCQKEEMLSPEEQVNTAQNEFATDGRVVLGDKLENAYSVENMEKAYKNLRQQGTSISGFSVKTSHLYVRFLAKDSTELNLLWNDADLELFTYPLDYEIKQEGNFYHDPSIPADDPTWLYTVVPVNYQFPNVEHEILEHCFIPEEDSAAAQAKGAMYQRFLGELELEALKITDNITPEELQEETERGLLPSKKYPQGYIRVNNTETSSLDGMSKIKVRMHRLVKISTVYTQENGYYKSTTGFRYNVHYSIIFENQTGFKIWGNWAFLMPARHSLGWHSKYGYNYNCYTNSKAWLWGTVNNATYIYREKLCPKFGVNKPPSSLRLWCLRMGGNWGGSAPMFRQISAGGSTISDFLISFGINALTGSIILAAPDIFILQDYTNTRSAYSVVFHELAHASHYTKAGKTYWLAFVAGIIGNGSSNAYGDGTGSLDGYIGVGEMWGYYFEYITEKDHFGYSYLSNSYWFKPRILRRLDDNHGFTPSQIFQALVSSSNSHSDLKAKLISLYPWKTTQINEAFSYYGF